MFPVEFVAIFAQRRAHHEFLHLGGKILIQGDYQISLGESIMR